MLMCLVGEYGYGVDGGLVLMLLKVRDGGVLVFVVRGLLIYIPVVVYGCSSGEGGWFGLW